MINSLTAAQPPKIDPVVDSMPKEWTSEQQVIAKDIMAVLQRHYPGWLWGLEVDQTWDKKLNAFIIRLQDIPSETVYVLHAKDIDRDRMHCAMIAGGVLLEAHSLSRTKWKHDEVHGLKTTKSGLIIPDYAAVPDNNPGFAKIKKQFNDLK